MPLALCVTLSVKLRSELVFAINNICSSSNSPLSPYLHPPLIVQPLTQIQLPVVLFFKILYYLIRQAISGLALRRLYEVAFFILTYLIRASEISKHPPPPTNCDLCADALRVGQNNPARLFCRDRTLWVICHTCAIIKQETPIVPVKLYRKLSPPQARSTSKPCLFLLNSRQLDLRFGWPEEVICPNPKKKNLVFHVSDFPTSFIYIALKKRIM